MELRGLAGTGALICGIISLFVGFSTNIWAGAIGIALASSGLNAKGSGKAFAIAGFVLSIIGLLYGLWTYMFLQRLTGN